MSFIAFVCLLVKKTTTKCQMLSQTGAESRLGRKLFVLVWMLWLGSASSAHFPTIEIYKVVNYVIGFLLSLEFRNYLARDQTLYLLTLLPISFPILHAVTALLTIIQVRHDVWYAMIPTLLVRVIIM